VKRPLAVLTIPLAVLGFVACGDDDDDNTGTTTATTVSATEPVETTAETTAATTAETTAETTGDTGGGATLPSLPDISLPDITLPGGITLPSLPNITLPDVSEIEEQVKQQFVQLGMTEEQAQCLVDKLDLSSGQMPDLSSIMDLLGECDINLGDLNPDG
jgi:hypothetical protein